MASAVIYGQDDLKYLVGELVMELRIRTRREDTLVARVAELEAALAKTQAAEAAPAEP